MALLDAGIRPVLRAAALRCYGGYLRGSAWLMLGAGSAEVISHLSGFIVVGMFATLALAQGGAGRSPD